jgi:hypothetical protein
MQKDSRKTMEKMRIDNAKRTYLGQRVLGVEIISGQVHNCMILGELGKIPDPPVDILLLHQIFRDSRRICQARVTPKLGKTIVQGLNPTLHKKHHELDTRQSASSTSFQSLDAGQQWCDLLHLSICGRRIPRCQFLQFFGGIKRGQAVLIIRGGLTVFDVKPFGPPTLD